MGSRFPRLLANDNEGPTILCAGCERCIALIQVLCLYLVGSVHSLLIHNFCEHESCKRVAVLDRSCDKCDGDISRLTNRASGREQHFIFYYASHSAYSLKRTMEHEVDAWIEQLSQCKQLSEADVKNLCDKVG